MMKPFFMINFYPHLRGQIMLTVEHSHPPKTHSESGKTLTFPSPEPLLEWSKLGAQGLQ